MKEKSPDTADAARAAELEARIKARGRELFALAGGEKPSLFDRSWWTGRVLDWGMRREEFKVQLFRFVDVYPALTTARSLGRHIREYFGPYLRELGPVFQWGIGAMGSELVSRALGGTIRSQFESMARHFIIGGDTAEALKSIRRLREEGFAASVDILGEATVSEKEAAQYQQAYLELLEALDREQSSWPGLGERRPGGGGGELDWGYSPRIQLSVKLTGLYSQLTPADFEGSARTLSERLRPILIRARSAGAAVCIDMEQHRTKDLVLEAYRRLRADPELRAWPHLAVVLQAYLRRAEEDLESLLDWAAGEDLPLSIRLVKGAYWDYETLVAGLNGWEVPVYSRKAETDAAFERLAARILERHESCYLACGSHSIRSIAAVMETARALKVPPDRYEFQLLYGMAEPVRRALLKAGERVRLYCPYGRLLPGMSYLVRRLLENTANESFLRQRFAEGVDLERLLANPAGVDAGRAGAAEAQLPPAASAPPATRPATAASDSVGGVAPAASAPPFANEPAADFTRPEARAAFPRAIREVRGRLGRAYPLLIGGREVHTPEKLASVNPAAPGEVVGLVCQGGRGQIDRAVEEAGRAFRGWRDTPAEQRCRVLFRAAAAARRRIYELAAWQVLEVGKQWDQAYADVAEAIDFLEYYGRQMLRLAAPARLGRLAGEDNRYLYRPRGLAAVIAPWNFPLAISCGMSSAAIAAGNCVLYKPSGLSPVTGWLLAELFQEAGLPPGVFNYLPFRGGELGDYLIDHPRISLIAFTGSREVGLRILERAARVQPGQQQVKRVVAEMGGKNAVIVDEDADLDEAVTHVVSSAFGYQGQKCSACSRVIVLEQVYGRFVDRLVEAAASLRIGPAEDPANFLGPVIDAAAQKRIRRYIEIGTREGTPLLVREPPGGSPPEAPAGFYAPLAVFGGVEPGHRLAQEEIFGPVLSVMKAESFERAIELANSTPYALTGGVFSRSPAHLEQAARTFEAGNLYLNRGITGALVGRQPFGGLRMSGVGSKAGGPDYLLQFLEPRTVTENTIRRGFAPGLE